MARRVSRTALSALGLLAIATSAAAATAAPDATDVAPLVRFSFDDQVPVTGTTLSAFTVPPTVLSCAKSGSSTHPSRSTK